jgi:hypothetical protein
MEAYEQILQTSKEAQETLGGVKKTLDVLPKKEDFSLEKLKEKLTN